MPTMTANAAPYHPYRRITRRPVMSQTKRQSRELVLRPKRPERRRSLRRALERPRVPAALEEHEIGADARREALREDWRDVRIVLRPEDEGRARDLLHVRLPFASDVHR